MKDLTYLNVCEYVKSSGIAQLISSADAVAVGFSGGADSALLCVFLKKYLKDKKLFACHLNHMIREGEADRDNEFAKAFCLERGIDFIEEKADILSIAKKEKLGTEECARRVRYEFFDRCRKIIAENLGITEDKVLAATAHNADDNLETVLFNLTRGSGTRGIGGITPVRDNNYIRPLLCLSAAEIREYCAESGIPYVVDSSNETDEYTRNVIRHSVVPVLKSINPSVTDAVLGTSYLAREDDAFLFSLAEKFIENNGDEPKCRELVKSGYPVASRAVKLIFEKICDEDISKVNITDVIELVFSGRSGSIDLPGKITADVTDRLVFRKSEKKDKTTCKPQPYGFALKNGLNDCANGAYTVGLFDSFEELSSAMGNIYNSLITVPLNNGKIKGNLFVRNRKEADVYLLRCHHRKVKKLMCEKKIPVGERDLLPIICDDDGIIWIPGFEPRDGAKSKADGADTVFLAIGKAK